MSTLPVFDIEPCPGCGYERATMLDRDLPHPGDLVWCLGCSGPLTYVNDTTTEAAADPGGSETLRRAIIETGIASFAVDAIPPPERGLRPGARLAHQGRPVPPGATGGGG